MQEGACRKGWLAWLLRWKSRIKYRFYVHGKDVETAAINREYSWMVRRVLSAADTLIVISHNTVTLLCDGWGVSWDTIVVLHPGVDTQRLCPAP